MSVDVRPKAEHDKKQSPSSEGLYLFVVQQRHIEPRFVMGQNTDDLDKFIFQFVASADDVDHTVFFQKKSH